MEKGAVGAAPFLSEVLPFGKVIFSGKVIFAYGASEILPLAKLWGNLGTPHHRFAELPLKGKPRAWNHLKRKAGVE